MGLPASEIGQNSLDGVEESSIFLLMCAITHVTYTCFISFIY